MCKKGDKVKISDDYPLYFLVGKIGIYIKYDMTTNYHHIEVEGTKCVFSEDHFEVL